MQEPRQIIFVFNLSGKKLTKELKSCQTKKKRKGNTGLEWKDETGDAARKSSSVKV